MDRVSKSLRKLDPKTRAEIETVISQIIRREFSGLDIKKLKGASRVFRVRVGPIRIVYVDDGITVTVLAIERRSEKTYR